MSEPEAMFLALALAGAAALAAWLLFARHRARRVAAAAAEPFPDEWRRMLARRSPLYRRMPPDLRRRLEPVTRAFLARVPFVGCNGLHVTDEMRVLVAVQASLLVVERDVYAYDELRSVLLYPDEFVVQEADEDEAGIVTEGSRALSGQTLDTARIVLSWRDVLESGDETLIYNVVLHEFAHYLDHSVGGMLSAADGAPRSLEAWHAVLEREYDALCDAADREEETLIDPYGAEDPAEFFAVAAETFFEAPVELEHHHPALYRELAGFFGLDPARWPTPSPAGTPPLS